MSTDQVEVSVICDGGSLRHLFEADDPVTRLTLQGTRQTSAGNTILRYARRAD